VTAIKVYLFVIQSSKIVAKSSVKDKRNCGHRSLYSACLHYFVILINFVHRKISSKPSARGPQLANFDRRDSESLLILN